MKIRRILNIVFRDFPIYYISRICNILPNNIVTCKIRGTLVSLFLKKNGKNFQLAEGSIINWPENLRIGNNVYFAHRIYINACSKLTIGNDVQIGPNVVIATANHSIVDNKVVHEGLGGEVIIGNGCWIGANVTIIGDVKIGDGVIVGAGAVVTKDIPSNVVVGGVPAVIIKK